LRKNNSGYDLNQLLIGSEGTLGIITAATLKLMPKPARVETALVTFPNPQKAIEALSILREATGDRLAAFEIMPRVAIECAVKFIANQRDPFPTPHPWVALVETHEAMADNGILEKALEILMEKKIAADAALAQSESQIKSFWGLREAIVEAQKYLGGSLKHDLSIPIGKTAEFIEKGAKLVESRVPGTRIYSFGHIGDGNIHFNLGQPEGMDKEKFLSYRTEISSLLNDLVLSLGGAISAEHGIGRFYRDEFLRVTPAVPVAIMQKIKHALDPQNILNPGVMV
jgi:FAD/FMN-containing dehydrogenase